MRTRGSKIVTFFDKTTVTVLSLYRTSGSS